MQGVIAQLRQEMIPLSHSGDFEILPLMTELESCIRTVESNPENAQEPLKRLLQQSQSFFRLAKSKDQLQQLSVVSRLLRVMQKEVEKIIAKAPAPPQPFGSSTQAEGLPQTMSQYPSKVPQQILQSQRVADQLSQLNQVQAGRKPTFAELARQVQQQSGPGVQQSGLALSQAMNAGPAVNFATMASQYQSGMQPYPQQQPQQDLSVLVENVKLIVNQLTLLQHDHQEQLRLNQKLREEMTELKMQLHEQAAYIGQVKQQQQVQNDVLEKKITGVKQLFKTFSVQSEFKDNQIIQLQREFEEIREIFDIKDGGSTERQRRIQQQILSQEQEFEAQAKKLRQIDQEDDEISAQMRQIAAMEEKIKQQQSQLTQMRQAVSKDTLDAVASGTPVLLQKPQQSGAENDGMSPTVQLSQISQAARPDIFGTRFILDESQGPHAHPKSTLDQPDYDTYSQISAQTK